MSATSTPSGNVRAVDYYQSAFGGFSPQKDEDAAVKFILHCILVADSFEVLPHLIEENHQIGAIEGDPGWRLERRDECNESNPAFFDWPAGSRFCARVEPDAYELAYPRYFMNRPQFMTYLRSALKAYVDANPLAATNPHFASLLQAK